VPVQVGTSVVTSTGTWTASGPLRYSGALVARFAGVTGQPAAQVSLGDVVAGTWDTSLSASASATQVVLGGTLTVSGTLIGRYLGVSEPAAGVSVGLYFQATGSSTRTRMSSVAVSAAGTFSMRVYPKSSGTWTVEVVNVAGYANASSASLPVTVG